MTQEEKELLLADLCTRLPYGVKVKVLDKDILAYDSKDGFIKGKENMEDDDFVVKCHNDSWLISCEGFKPYLRQISSMTEEEQNECINLIDIILNPSSESDKISKIIDCLYENIQLMDWFNKKHFDYRRLIDKGLALVAPSGMYNTKSE